MKLECFFTLWGWSGSAVEAVHHAKQAGFDGIEGQVPTTPEERILFAAALSETGLSYIQEIATTGTYVPDRSLTLEDHLSHFEKELTAAAGVLNPRFISCLGGCDAWSMEQSIVFFRRAQALAEKHKKVVSFETHRGRILYNPWRCAQICQAIPNLKLTFDISHWCVVCEGLQETEIALIEDLAVRAQHIHARVGYDQGPQVPQPFEGTYKQDLHTHLKIWKNIWKTQLKRGQARTSVTPEFGVDGYEYRSPDGNQPLVDPLQINIQMMNALKNDFQKELHREISLSK